MDLSNEDNSESFNLFEEEENNPNFEERLILLVQEKPILYDLQNINYNNEVKTDNEWKEISLNCGKSVDECKSLWTSLRDTFTMEKRQLPKPETGNNQQEPWKYLQSLEFLTPTLTKSRSDSNHLTQRGDISVATPMDLAGPSAAPIPAKRRRHNIMDRIVDLLEIDLEEDSNTKFALSLVGPLSRLSPQKNSLARIRIQQVLYDIEFGSD